MTPGPKKVQMREYGVWLQMKNRCTNPNNRAWPNYGGRGITVCPQWVDSFDTFLADVGPRPSARHTIGRIDNDQGYFPDNVEWQTWEAQMRNKRTTKNSQPITPGFRSGMLVVVGEGPRTEKGFPTMICRCDCGTERVVKMAQLRGGCPKSCGCLKRGPKGPRGPKKEKKLVPWVWRGKTRS